MNRDDMTLKEEIKNTLSRFKPVIVCPFSASPASPDGIPERCRQNCVECMADEILSLIKSRLKPLTDTEAVRAITDYRRILEMNGHKPTVADSRKAVSQATIEKIIKEINDA